MEVSIVMHSNLCVHPERKQMFFHALDSAKRQNFKDWQIIVVNHNRSVSANMNEGLKQVKGKYVKFLADDDFMPENCLRDLYDGIKGYDFICAKAQEFGDGNCVYNSKPQSLEGLLKRNTIHGGTTFYRTEMLLEVGGYDESLACAEEYDLHLNLLSKGYKLGYIPTIVYNYRVHEGQKNQKMSRHKRHDEIEAIKDRYR